MEEKNIIVPILRENRKLKLKLNVALQALKELESEPRGVARTALEYLDYVENKKDEE